MTKHPTDLLPFAYSVSLHPQMYAYNPEVAHGILKSLSWVILHESTKKELGVCIRITHDIIKQVMSHVYLSETQTPLLCDEKFIPVRKSSFEAFRVNSKTFLDNLCACIDSNKKSDSCS